MAENATIAKPVSRRFLQDLAYTIRKKFRLEDCSNFPVVRFVEFILPSLDPEFVLEIIPINEMPKDCYADTCVAEHVMRIREDVYEGAVGGNGRDRFTIAHEIGHYFLHGPDRVSHARLRGNQSVPAYMDPEWQGNAFAAELLMPRDLIQGYSVAEVVKCCGVSYQAARIQLGLRK